MKHRTIFLSVWMLLFSWSVPVRAQTPGDFSANAMMPGCVGALGNADSFGAGYCAGVVRALMNTSFAFKACPPAGVSVGQSIRVAVAFINQNPARMREPFEGLVIEALRSAWPCKN
jgi:hypothetical protein